MLSDIEIAHRASLRPVSELAEEYGLLPEEVEFDVEKLKANNVRKVNSLIHASIQLVEVQRQAHHWTHRYDASNSDG